MRAVICPACRLIQGMADSCAACEHTCLVALDDSSEAILVQKTELETNEPGSGSTNQAWWAVGIWMAAIVTMIVVGETFGSGAVLGWAMLGTVVAVVASTRFLSLGPTLTRRIERELTASPPDRRLVLPPPADSVHEGVTRKLEGSVESHADGRPCLVSAVNAIDRAGRVYVRARRSVELLVEADERLIAVTGEVWLVPSGAHSTPIDKSRVGVPAHLEILAELASAVVRDGDRVRVHGTPEIEPHRAFSAYRDATGPVLRGRPGAPIIIERID